MWSLWLLPLALLLYAAARRERVLTLKVQVLEKRVDLLCRARRKARRESRPSLDPERTAIMSAEELEKVKRQP